jgi:hypothetical protein
MSVTWCSLDRLCRERGWKKPRVILECQNGGLLIRSVPPGSEHRINIHDPDVQESLDIEASQVSVFDPELAEPFSGRGFVVVGNGATILDIEVALPPAGAAHPPVKRWRKPPSPAAIKTAARAVAKTYQPDDPPTQAEWWTRLNAELGEPVTRKVAFGALTNWAPQLQRRPGQKPNRRS